MIYKFDDTFKFTSGGSELYIENVELDDSIDFDYEEPSLYSPGGWSSNVPHFVKATGSLDMDSDSVELNLSLIDKKELVEACIQKEFEKVMLK